GGALQSCARRLPARGAHQPTRRLDSVPEHLEARGDRPATGTMTAQATRGIRSDAPIRVLALAGCTLVIAAALVLAPAVAGHAATIDPAPPVDGLSVEINGPDGEPS